MATIERVRASWYGFPGAPGVSTFYFTDAALHQDALRTFFFTLTGLLPLDVTVDVETGGDTLDDATGLINGAWTGAGQAPVTGALPGVYHAAGGAMIRWETGTVQFGRRFRARTFLVPGGGTIYSGGGGIDTPYVTAGTAAAQALISAHVGNMVAWSRPRLARGSFVDSRGVTHPAVSARAGFNRPIVDGALRSKAVILRSRRD